MNAGKDSSPDAREAFGELYRAYLPALLVFLRRTGRNEEEAKDLASGFFELLLENNRLGAVNRTGRFRNWLLTCLKHYVSDVWDKKRAAKRGGGQPHVPLEPHGEEECAEPPHPGRSPDEEYERQYAITFLEQVISRLEREYQARGKARLFESLHPLLHDKKSDLSHAQLGQRLEMAAGTVSTEISRLRRRYREIFDEELAKLVGDRREVEDEKRFLFTALSK